MLVQALYNVVDSIFVGQFNSDALEAVSLAFPMQNLMISFAVGIGVGTNSLVARHLGEKRPDRASEVANTGIFLNLIGYAAFAVLAIFIITPFFGMQTSIPEVAEYGKDYLSVIMFFGFGIFLEITGERLLQSTGMTKLSMISQATGAVINIILDPILIFGYLGAPQMGARGAAIATVTGQIIAGSVLFDFLRGADNHDIGNSLLQNLFGGVKCALVHRFRKNDCFLVGFCLCLDFINKTHNRYLLLSRCPCSSDDPVYDHLKAVYTVVQHTQPLLYRVPTSDKSLFIQSRGALSVRCGRENLLRRT